MDELIKKYAQILREARVGDFTYEGILYHFAQEIKEKYEETISNYEGALSEYEDTSKWGGK